MTIEWYVSCDRPDSTCDANPNELQFCWPVIGHAPHNSYLIECDCYKHLDISSDVIFGCREFQRQYARAELRHREASQLTLNAEQETVRAEELSSQAANQVAATEIRAVQLVCH